MQFPDPKAIVPGLTAVPAAVTHNWGVVVLLLALSKVGHDIDRAKGMPFWFKRWVDAFEELSTKRSVWAERRDERKLARLRTRKAAEAIEREIRDSRDL